MRCPVCGNDFIVDVCNGCGYSVKEHQESEVCEFCESDTCEGDCIQAEFFRDQQRIEQQEYQETWGAFGWNFS